MFVSGIRAYAINRPRFGNSRFISINIPERRRRRGTIGIYEINFEPRVTLGPELADNTKMPGNVRTSSAAHRRLLRPNRDAKTRSEYLNQFPKRKKKLAEFRSSERDTLYLSK